VRSTLDGVAPPRMLLGGMGLGLAWAVVSLRKKEAP